MSDSDRKKSIFFLLTVIGTQIDNVTKQFWVDYLQKKLAPVEMCCTEEKAPSTGAKHYHAVVKLQQQSRKVTIVNKLLPFKVDVRTDGNWDAYLRYILISPNKRKQNH